MTPLGVIGLSVLLGNVMFVTGLTNPNPISWTSHITFAFCRTYCERSMIDPNVGYLTQPLGHLAAMDLLHGHMPWWNYFEGLGQPLAGEMQGAALFPLTLLFALARGLMWFHIVLEVIAGASTYFLAKRLSMSDAVATGVGVLFALNGTFAWLGNAVLNPVAFLPMLLLGIEMIFAAALARARGGWYVAALALALSIYAGFPEVAYLDGLFGAGWALVQFFSLARDRRFVAARRLGLAGLVGGVLALPILVPFLDFLKVANVGNHVAAVAGVTTLSSRAVPMLLDPYVYGALALNPNVAYAWNGIGGYFTFSVTALALLGLFGTRHRPLRIFLGIWSAAGLLGSFNVAHFRMLWNLLPSVDTVGLSRYIFPSCEMALIVLAGLGIGDFATSARARRLFTTTTVVALGLLTWSAVSAASLNNGFHEGHPTSALFQLLVALPFVAAALLLIVGRFARARAAPLLVTLVLVVESLLLFVAPTTEAPRHTQVDQAPLTFLQTHQGQQRYLDLAVLYPNWGTQYGLNSLSAIDLPFPRELSDLIARQLYPALGTTNQFVVRGGGKGIVAEERAVVVHFAAFEGASVKYLMMPRAVKILPALTNLGVVRVFVDSLAAIYQLPAPRPFFSVASPSCAIASTTASTSTVTCSTAAASLVRTELAMPGWHAFVNAREVAITTVDHAYQSVRVPAGTSTVIFRFEPPHEVEALAAALLAVVYLLGDWISERGRARRR